MPIVIVGILLLNLPINFLQNKSNTTLRVTEMPTSAPTPVRSETHGKSTLGEQTTSLVPSRQPSAPPQQTVQTPDEQNNHVVNSVITPTVTPEQRAYGGVAVPITLTPTPSLTVSPTEAMDSRHNRDEKQQIDEWIVKNNLNQYGDPKDTAYAGGNPTFDMTTGKITDRYDYIISHHPDKPWTK